MLELHVRINCKNVSVPLIKTNVALSVPIVNFKTSVISFQLVKIGL